MSRQASGQQSLRSVSDNIFASNLSNARPQSQRLQNGKLSSTSGSTWGLGVPQPPGTPVRTGTLANFAQAIGGGAPAQNASLDLSEFPSLSGGPQPSNLPSTSQAWNNTSQRTPSSTQRSGVGSAQQQQQQQSAEPPIQSLRQANSFAFGAGQDGRFGGQRQADPLTAPEGNPQTPADEFPPLNGLGGSSIADARISGTQGNGHTGPETQISAIGMDVRSGQDDFRRPAADGSQRNPVDSRETWNDGHGASQHLPIRENGFSTAQQAPIGQGPAPQPASYQGSSFGTQMIEATPADGQSNSQQQSFSDMTEADKWGLPGLLAMLPGRGSGPASNFIMGQDLNSLGLDFDSPEPMTTSLTTPFADPSSRPAIPEFSLPTAYSVNNVPALHTRIGNFTDETLFAIFYQYPRDVMQEIAASELYTRDWRWHTKLRQWMMKDTGMAQPVRITDRSERGVYVFFDAVNWRRARKDFVLNYDDLDQRHGPSQPGIAAH